MEHAHKRHVALSKTDYQDYVNYHCSRNYKVEKKGGRVKCGSRFSIKETFPKMIIPGINDEKEKPWSIVGFFNHDHPLELKYTRYPQYDKDLIDQKLQHPVSPTKIYENWKGMKDKDRRPMSYPYIFGRKRRMPGYRKPGENLLDSLERLFQDPWITDLNVEDFLNFHKNELSQCIQGRQ